jgi:hypothetical protein
MQLFSYGNWYGTFSGKSAKILNGINIALILKNQVEGEIIWIQLNVC